ncbi:MAG: hypothetical protein OXC44_07585 [Proteobacteria bacterium]|nr:hypothetical protein [Pseudomonadota bacterium]MCY4444642.1 hypothetical protein [Pseudomonadota bacterium]
MKNTFYSQPSQQRGSIAFEYVVVTLMGIGISLVVMQVAKKVIYEKLSTMQDRLEETWDDGFAQDSELDNDF